MSAEPINIHATALIAGDRGILIRGASGAGKTTLALTLISQAQLVGRFAALVADDQSFVVSLGGRAIASAPHTILGLAEVHGFGPRRLAFRRQCQVDLVVDLVDGEIAPRFQELGAASVAGVVLPSLMLASRESRRSSLAIAAWLEWPPFGH